MMHRGPGPRKRLRLVHRVALPLAILVFCGCPRRFDPRAEPITVSSPDPVANEAYRDAKAQLDRGELAAAAASFADFAGRFPGDPLAPVASLWEARAALGLGDAARATARTEPLATRPPGDPVGERARFLLGLARVREGDAARGRELLRPFAGIVAAGDDAVELAAALAEAATRLSEWGEALSWYQQFYQGARPVEQTYIRERGRQIVAALPDAELARLWNESPRDSLTAALVGPRVAELFGARVVAAESNAAQQRFGLLVTPAERGEVPPLTIGLVLPLSGRNRLLGERALRGALLAADALPASAGTVEMWVRDTQSIPERAAAAVDELAAAGVAAVVASPDRAEAQSAAARAAPLGLPVLELAPDETRHSGPVFKLLRPNPARAEALAARAVAGGALRVAILYPDSPYGKRMAEAAARAVVAPAKVVAQIAFDEKATTFISPVKKIAEARAQAVLIPSTAQQLELIAAQMYASGLTRSTGGKPAQRTAAARIFATADGATTKLLATSGRYLQGAFLAPVFFPDGSDAGSLIGGFVVHFRDRFTDDPGTADALAWDAVRALRAAAAELPAPGEGRRAQLARRLGAATSSGEGLAGPLLFVAGERAGTPPLFLVDGDAARLQR